MAPSIPLNEPERLLALTKYSFGDAADPRAFTALAELAALVLETPMAGISIVDADRQWFAASHGFAAGPTPRERSFCADVVAKAEPLVVLDAGIEDRFADLPLVAGPPHVRFYAGHPLRTPEGFVLGALCVLDDRAGQLDRRRVELLGGLADQVIAQLELERSRRLLGHAESRLHTILGAAPDAIIAVDERGIVEDANPASQALLGYARGELVGQEWVKLIAGAPAGVQANASSRDLISGERRTFGQGRELAIRRKDGSLAEVELTLGVMRTQGRQHFTAILRDISQRKEADRRLHETLADLRRSRDELGQVLNQLQIGTLALDASGAVTFASETCARVAGIDADSAAGQRWEDVLLADEATRVAVRAHLRSPAGERARVEAQIGRGTAARWIEIDVRDDPRNPAARMLFLYDVTAVHAMRAELRAQSHGQMVGDSAAMRTLYDAIEQVAPGDWTVLIEGETGVGKELVAQAIHRGSTRRGGAFVAVNCAGLAESILGSQLFGHRKGAFTGAIADQEGLFEAAHGGTLFLDEIGDVAMPIQSALLRVLQEREITRIGETRPRKVDVRIVAATNRDLVQRVASGHFREDLLYRLRGARVPVPPLRERREDIPALVASFLAEERVTGGKLVTDLAPDALALLQRHRWPGNVRELRGVVEHAVIRCRGRRIEVGDLPPELVQAPASVIGAASATAAAAPAGDDERGRILAALQRTAGNRARAARLLGVGRATLYRRLAELGIGPATGDDD